MLGGLVRFQSTLPARGATVRRHIRAAKPEFQSTLPARGATNLSLDMIFSDCNISIHAPREGSDTLSTDIGLFGNYFNPRSPRGERLSTIADTFSTLSISIHAPREGSDNSPPVRTGSKSNFNPRSPRGERHGLFQAIKVIDGISIHAPREGSDSAPHDCGGPAGISIHAPREGSDLSCRETLVNMWHFNPRSPRGERLLYEADLTIRWLFQSTLPARGATRPKTGHKPTTTISIHAPREGSDLILVLTELKVNNFNPRSPRGERRSPPDNLTP